MVSDAAHAGDGQASSKTGGKRPYVAPKLTRLGLLRKLTRYTF